MLAAVVTGHPWATGLVPQALLVPLIIPMFSLHLGQEDIGAAPKSTTERQAFDLMAAKYGPGDNGPLLTATELDTPAKPSKEYEDKYNQAKANQADLEKKQKELTAEGAALQRQGDALQAQADNPDLASKISSQLLELILVVLALSIVLL